MDTESSFPNNTNNLELFMTNQGLTQPNDDQESIEQTLPEIVIESPIMPHSTDIEHKLTWRERMADLSSRFSNIGSASKDDLKHADNKRATTAWGITALGTQAIDRLRIGVVVVPTIAVDVMQNTHNSALTGFAAGGAFLIWNGLVGAAFGKSLDKFPKTVQSFTENFPAVVDGFTYALPGIEKQVDFLESKDDISSLRNILRSMKMHGKRSMSVIGIGTTAYVGTAATNGYSSKNVQKLNLAASADGAALAGTVGFGVSKTIKELALSGHMETANHIQNFFSSSKLYLGLATISIGSEVISKKMQHGKERRQQKDI